jgi:hypothetical protein
MDLVSYVTERILPSNSLFIFWYLLRLFKAHKKEPVVRDRLHINVFIIGICYMKSFGVVEPAVT